MIIVMLILNQKTNKNSILIFNFVLSSVKIKANLKENRLHAVPPTSPSEEHPTQKVLIIFKRAAAAMREVPFGV